MLYRLVALCLFVPTITQAQLVDKTPAAIPNQPRVYQTEPYEDPLVSGINRDASRATAYSFISSNQLALPQSSAPAAKKQTYAAVSLTENAKNFTLEGNGFSVEIDKTNGALTSYELAGKEQIFAPLLPHFSRPLTDNDKRGWKAQRKLKPWYDPTLTLKSLTAQTLAKGQVKLTSTYSLIHGSASVQVDYLVRGDGVVGVDFAIKPAFPLPNMPKVGMQGGNDSWSDVAAPLDQYQIKAKPYQYSFYLLPLTKPKEEPGAVARKIKQIQPTPGKGQALWKL